MRGILKALPLGVGLPLIIAAASFGPEDAVSNLSKWAHWLGVQSVPDWLVSKSADHKAVPLFILLALLYAAMVWGVPYVRRRHPATIHALGDPAGLPIAVSHIQRQSFSNYVGFPADQREWDAQSVSFGEVTITNISTKEKVVLDLVLHITGTDGTNFKTHADLIGPFGMILGKDNKAAKLLADAPFGEAQRYFRNPVELLPGQVERRRLEFLFNFGESELRNTIVSILTHDQNYNFDLEITDLISGKAVTVRLPGAYRGDQ